MSTRSGGEGVGPKRRAVMEISGGVLAALFTTRQSILVRPVGAVLPADTRPVGLWFHEDRGTFLLLLESASFAPVPVGAAYPEVPAPSLEIVTAGVG